MTGSDAADLAARLGREAEAVCRTYLSAGRRVGQYWVVGDVRNGPGRSMFVRLGGPGAAGRWTDAATGEHGDLLDVIRAALGLRDFREAADEARRFLGVGRVVPGPPQAAPRPVAGDRDTAKAARRLFQASRPIAGTLAEIYLANRGIPPLPDTAALRFHPRCFYWRDRRATPDRLPAMIAAVTDLAGRQTGAQRTWLAADGRGKAAVDTPRRAMGELLGHGVRFGAAGDVLAVGEGIETVLSVRAAFPGLPVLAALSASHLAAVRFPPGLRRLYVVCDRDPAGDMARETLFARAAAVGIEAVALAPVRGDFNDDLRGFGIGAVRAGLRAQLRPEDVERFLPRSVRRGGDRSR
ncbi:MAG: toprim domain-containing protein [Amaricoccus sp.]|uniref:DUF7146 domain-containing protein n=1 Tax=Amaricoccus sp. TaxID=1872485 RepID=UPI003315858B